MISRVLSTISDLKTHMPSEEAYQKALNEGHSAAWDQDWATAEECFRRALQEFPDQPKALNSLGLALYQLGHFEESLATYVRVSRLTPEDPLAAREDRAALRAPRRHPTSPSRPR